MAELVKKARYLKNQTRHALKTYGPKITMLVISDYLLHKDRPKRQERRPQKPELNIKKGSYYYDFVLDFNPKKKFKEKKLPKRKLKINWIVPDFGIGSGGHMTIFRIVKGLEELGHENRVYIMGRSKYRSPENARQVIIKHFIPIDAKVFIGANEMKDSDVCFATSWQTAYPLYKAKNTKKKMYFVQDLENEFYPKSAESVFAEQTYKMGFKCVTAGKWLTKVMKKRYALKAGYFELAHNPSIYWINKKVKKDPKKIVFYARVVTPRRGLELGFLALREVLKKRKGVKASFFGWDCRQTPVPFNYENLGILKENQLAVLYNEAAVGVVLSLTNYSLVPQEMMACGLPVVDVEGDNTETAYPKGSIVLAEPTPSSLAERIIYLLDHPKTAKKVQRKALDYVKKLTWEKQAKKVEKLIYKL